MALSLSRSYLSSLAGRYHNLRSRHERVIERGEKVVAQVGKTLEIGGSAFAFGVLQGKTGGVEVLGVPLDLGLGVLGHLAAFTLVSGRNAHHFHNIADGALACFAATQGRGFGIQWKSTGKLFGHGGAVRGGLESGHGMSVEDSELANLARSL